MKHIMLGFLHADQNAQMLINFVLHLLKRELWKQRNLVKCENCIICENSFFNNFETNWHLAVSFLTIPL